MEVLQKLEVVNTLGYTDYGTPTAAAPSAHSAFLGYNGEGHDAQDLHAAQHAKKEYRRYREQKREQREKKHCEKHALLHPVGFAARAGMQVGAAVRAMCSNRWRRRRTKRRRRTRIISQGSSTGKTPWCRRTWPTRWPRRRIILPNAGATMPCQIFLNLKTHKQYSMILLSKELCFLFQLKPLIMVGIGHSFGITLFQVCRVQEYLNNTHN